MKQVARSGASGTIPGRTDGRLAQWPRAAPAIFFLPLSEHTRTYANISEDCSLIPAPRSSVKQVKKVLRSFKYFAFPFLRSAFPRLQRARPQSRLDRPTIPSATICSALSMTVPAGPYVPVHLNSFFGRIWSDLLGSDGAQHPGGRAQHPHSAFGRFPVLGIGFSEFMSFGFPYWPRAAPAIEFCLHSPAILT